MLSEMDSPRLAPGVPHNLLLCLHRARAANLRIARYRQRARQLVGPVDADCEGLHLPFATVPVHIGPGDLGTDQTFPATEPIDRLAGLGEVTGPNRLPLTPLAPVQPATHLRGVQINGR